MTKFNMNKIEGIDANIEESLFCYGLAWILSDDKSEYKFYYGVHTDHKGNYDQFDIGFYSSDLDVKREFDNLTSDNWKSILSFTSMESADFFNRELPYIISDLLQYYGYINVFGDCYSAYKYLPNINRFQSV